MDFHKGAVISFKKALRVSGLPAKLSFGGVAEPEYEG
jgi:hypothetical protein